MSYFYIIKITISIHALLAESDQSRVVSRQTEQNFYPRSPCGERQHESADDMYLYEFLSTLSLRRATDVNNPVADSTPISIHALLAESDGFRYFYIIKITNFYPRSPCGERLHLFASSGVDFAISIHALLAESDGSLTMIGGFGADFYPRSPCGERPPPYNLMIQHKKISIHALLAESDETTLDRVVETQISIHALLAESDAETAHKRANRLAFLSTLSLRRATNQLYINRTAKTIFLSTLSLRRATSGYLDTRQPCAISIHALLAESDTLI